jgi:hypothetical protein
MVSSDADADKDTLDSDKGNDLNNFLINMGFHSTLSAGLGSDTMLSGFVPGYTVYMEKHRRKFVITKGKIKTRRMPSSNRLSIR